MAIELVGGSIVEAEQTVGQPTITRSYTIGSTGANTALIVLVHNAKKAQVITSVKWNTNEDLTLVGEKDGSAYHRVSIYRLLNPTATTADIVVTFDAEPTYGACLIAFLLTGVDSSTPTSDNQSNNGNAASSSVVIPNCMAGDMAIAVGGAENNVVSYAVTTGTEIWKGLTGNWDDTGSAYNTGTGNVTIAFSHGNKEYCIIGCRIRTAPAGAPYMLDAGVGAFAVAGQATGLLMGRNLGAGVGAYALAGKAVETLLGRKLDAGTGTYALTGQTLGLLLGRKLNVEVGAYALTGRDLDLLMGRNLAAEAGAYAVTGQPISLLLGRVVSIEAGIYTVTGQAVTLTYTPVGGYTINIEPGSYSIAGQAVDLLKASRLEITPGSYVVTGQDATLTLGTALAIPIIIHIDGRAFIRDLDKRLKIARLETSPKIRNVDKRR